MRKIICLLCLICVIACSIFLPASADEIHYISCEEELFDIENHPTGIFYLTSDIVVQNKNDVLFKTKDNVFNGVLDGKGYTIYSLNLSNDEDLLSFVGYLGKKGTIRNLNFKEAYYESENKTAVVGGIVAYNYGNITNCNFSGYILQCKKPINESKYICAHDSGKIIESKHQVIEPKNSNSITDVASEDDNIQFEGVINSAPHIDTHSQETASKMTIDNKDEIVASTSSKKTSSKKTDSKTTITSDTDNVSIREYYGNNLSQYSTDPESNSAGRFIMIASAAVLVLMLAFLVYKEIKFYIENRNKKE